ncbi:MAG: ABC transporter permease [Filifactoraceae bacterium]
MKEHWLSKKILIICLYLGVWQIIYLTVNQEILIVSPLSVCNKILELLVDKNFYSSIIHSFSRILAGFSLAIIVGIFIGWLTYRSKLIYQFLSPALIIIKATPVVSFIILALVWMSTDFLTIFISFLMVLPLVWKNIHQGFVTTDPKLLEMAKIFDLNQKQILKQIFIPNIVPYFYAAVTTGLGFAWKSGVAAEVIGIPKSSIGTNLYNAKIYIDTVDLFAWTIIIILLSMLMEKFIILLMNKWLRSGDEL